MRKTTLLSIVALLMALMIGVSGTMAYLQDSDADVNVMTLGNVYIEQIEEQLAADGLTIEPYEQNKPFYPGCDVSKIVSVENTGKSDAYIRTIFAFETVDSETFDISFTIDETNWSVGALEAVVEIDGKTFEIYEAVYTGVLAPGETSPVSLSKVTMSATATNEDMEALGGEYEILVVSQAVQTEGFSDPLTALDAAFGNTTANNHPWMGENAAPTAPVVVGSADELKAAFAAGGNIVLAKSINMGEEALTVPAGTEIKLDLNGNTLTVKNTEAKASSAINNNGSLTITGNGTVSYEGVGSSNNAYGTNTITNNDGGVLVIDGATLINNTATGSSNAIDNAPGSKLTVKSGKLIAKQIAVRVRDNADVTIEGGEITGKRAVQIQLFQKVDAPTTVNFKGGTMTATDETYNLAFYSTSSSGSTFAKTTVNIEGGTFNGNVYFGGGDKTHKETVSITGGTFNGEIGRYLANDGWEHIGGYIPVTSAEDLKDALTESGDYILQSNITVSDETLSIAQGANVTLNLNGKTVSGTSTTTGKNKNLFVVKGNLTVTDGSVVMKHTGANMGWGNAVSSFSVEGGTLTLSNVQINTSGSDMSYGVDVNTTLGASTLNIENNTSIVSSYTGVRIFNNHHTAKGTVNLNSGSVVGNGTSTRDIWMQNPSASAVDANGIVNINNGAEYTKEVQNEGSFYGRIYRFD